MNTDASTSAEEEEKEPVSSARDPHRDQQEETDEDTESSVGETLIDPQLDDEQLGRLGNVAAKKQATNENSADYKDSESDEPEESNPRSTQLEMGAIQNPFEALSPTSEEQTDNQSATEPLPEPDDPEEDQRTTQLEMGAIQNPFESLMPAKDTPSEQRDENDETISESGQAGEQKRTPEESTLKKKRDKEKDVNKTILESKLTDEQKGRLKESALKKKRDREKNLNKTMLESNLTDEQKGRLKESALKKKRDREKDVNKTILESKLTDEQKGRLKESARKKNHGFRDSMNVMKRTILERRGIEALAGTFIREKYFLRQLLSNDGVSCLYLAREETEKKSVAVKIVNFRREADALEYVEEIKDRAVLEHENVCTILDAFSSKGGRAYVVIEYPDNCVSVHDVVTGVDRLKKETDIGMVLSQICEGLIFAHENGIVHGSLSPEKVLIREITGKVVLKIMDFGQTNLNSEFSNYLGSGKVIYSPECISPELLDGFEPQPRSDVYSLGVLAYRLIAGRYPYEAAEYSKVIESHKDPETMPEPISSIRPEMIQIHKLSQIVYEAMETDPDWRFESVRDFKNNIDEWLKSVQLELQVHEASTKTTVKLGQEDLRDLKSSLLDLVALRQASIEQEETVAVQLADRLKFGGQRQSPLKTFIKVGAISFITTFVLATVTYVAINNQQDLRALWNSTSRQVSAFITGYKSRDDQLVTEEPSVDDTGATSDEVTSASKTKSVSGNVKKRPRASRKRFRKFRYEDSYEYQKFAPTTEPSKPLIIE